jgi:glycosyltransferase involved in cell wall biosynthesis
MIGETRPLFSLIVATAGRRVELSRFLESLRHQTCSRCELIIVDQSDDGVASSVCAGFDGSFDVQVLSSAQGASRARNLGLERATGELVAFPDDDCWYPPGLLADVLEWFDRNGEYDFVSGSYTEPGRHNPRFPSKETDLNTLNGPRRATGVTVFFRRRVFTEGLRYDEELGPGTSLPWGEDTDLVLEAIARRHRGRYCPRLVVHHRVERESVTALSSVLGRERCFSYVLAKHGFRPSLACIFRLVARSVPRLLSATYSRRGRQILSNQLAGVRLAISRARR